MDVLQDTLRYYEKINNNEIDLAARRGFNALLEGGKTTCVPQTTAKFKPPRKAPPMYAKDCKKKIKRGNNKKMFKSTPTKRRSGEKNNWDLVDTYTWIPSRKKNQPICREKTSTKYTTRNSPPYDANECAPRVRRRKGNDGMMYKARLMTNEDDGDHYQWVRMKRYKTPSKKAAPRRKRKESAMEGIGALKACNKNARQLSVPTTKYFNDPCRFLDCWVSQRRATSFPRMAGILKKKRKGGFHLVSVGADKRKRGSDLSIVIGKNSKRLSQGANGAVYTSTIKHRAGSRLESKNSIIKINFNEEDPEEDVEEAIMQVILFCQMRKIVLPFTTIPFYKEGRKDKYEREIDEIHGRERSPIMYRASAGIPKIETIASVKDNYSKSRVTNMIAMEPLDGTLGGLVTGWFKKSAPLQKGYNEFNDAITGSYYGINPVEVAMVQLSTTLLALQRSVNFEHRDMHSENIMYKVTNKHGLLGFNFYIIDFGYSRMEFGGRAFKGTDWGEKEEKTIVPGADLATTCVMLLDDILDKGPASEYLGDLFRYINTKNPDGRGHSKEYSLVGSHIWWSSITIDIVNECIENIFPRWMHAMLRKLIDGLSRYHHSISVDSSSSSSSSRSSSSSSSRSRSRSSSSSRSRSRSSSSSRSRSRSSSSSSGSSSGEGRMHWYCSGEHRLHLRDVLEPFSPANILTAYFESQLDPMDAYQYLGKLKPWIRHVI